MSVQIIVNADDLGISQTVNEAIFRGMDRKVITSASILSNGPAINAAACSLSRYSNCSFGIHLNLTEFTPVNKASYSELLALIDHNGHFIGDAIRRIAITPRIVRAIYEEWRAQIENLIRMGIEPSHIDGHHHVHTIPQLLPALVALRTRFKIRRVRASMNLYPPGSPRNTQMVLVRKRLYNLTLRACGFKTVGLFTGLETFIDVHALKRPSDRLIELMVHPGAATGEREAELLKGYWPERLAYPATLISYKSL